MPGRLAAQPTTQSLYLVMGGRVRNPFCDEFLAPDAIDLRGIYASYDEAYSVLCGATEATVDDAYVKYKIVRLT